MQFFQNRFQVLLYCRRGFIAFTLCEYTFQTISHNLALANLNNDTAFAHHFPLEKLPKFPCETKYSTRTKSYNLKFIKKHISITFF